MLLYTIYTALLVRSEVGIVLGVRSKYDTWYTQYQVPTLLGVQYTANDLPVSDHSEAGKTPAGWGVLIT